MITTIKKPLRFLLLVAVLGSCSKQKGFGPNYKDYNGGNTPVVITNAVDYRPDPTVPTAVAGDSSIKIVLAIPASSGRTIKEITKVATSSSYAAIQSTGTTGFYNVPVIPGSGTTVTFTTSIKEYYVNNPVSKTNPVPATNSELTFRYYFRLTLDDASVVYPTPVRVLVLQ
jgi:hypothetical protein